MSRLVIFLIVLTTKVKVKVSRIAHFQKFHAVLAHANCSVILSYFEVRQSFIRTLPMINIRIFFSELSRFIKTLQITKQMSGQIFEKYFLNMTLFFRFLAEIEKRKICSDLAVERGEKIVY